MTELKTVPEVDLFYDRHEWEFTTDDPDFIMENTDGVMELSTLMRGPTYFAFVDDHDEETRYFDNLVEAEAAYDKMCAAGQVKE